MQTWHAYFSPDTAAEAPSRLTWEIFEEDEGVTRLTVTHDVTDAPIAAAMIEGSANLGEGGGGYAWILSDLKTLLETGNAIES